MMEIPANRYKHILGDVTIVGLFDGDIGMADDSVGKAGVLPFCQDASGEYSFYLMRPMAARPELGPPEFQIAKGTRRIRQEGRWRDITYRDFPIEDLSRAEDILVTAIREGREEVGLVAENITTLYWGKVFSFASASMGGEKYMMIFAAEIKDREAFEEPDTLTAKTGECRWVSYAECQELVRDDHYQIIVEMHDILRNIRDR